MPTIKEYSTPIYLGEIAAYIGTLVTMAATIELIRPLQNLNMKAIGTIGRSPKMPPLGK